MRKVCILQNSLSFGGTDTFVINMCEGLMKDGYSVTVVLSMDPKKPGPKLNDLKTTGVRIIWTCSFKNIKEKLRHLLLLYKELRKERYDIFQTNIDLFNGPNLFISWLAGVPVRECHSHNSKQEKELQVGRKLCVTLYQTLMRWLCWNFSNRRGGCSEIAMDFLFHQKWKSDKYSKVVHNGIDFSEFRRSCNFDEKKKSWDFGKNIISVQLEESHFKKIQFLLLMS
ncbi:glycosyltransferase [Blautia schinkii]|nr:glycosyltransferase [Blautia schinkii]